MDSIRIGSSLRALRIRRGWRQSDLSLKAGTSRELVSEIERGRFDRPSVVDVQRLAAALGAEIDLRVRWRGEQLDRLLDEAHAATVAAALARLGRDGWESAVEASFSIWGERGSIDVLAWHHRTSTLLVIEVKSVIPDVQATIHDLDRKTRLAPQVAAERGWRPRAVGRLLIVAESPTSRGRVRRHAIVLQAALPHRGPAIRAWLRAPAGPIRGLMFLSNAAQAHPTGPIWRRERVHARRPARMCVGPALENDPGADHGRQSASGPQGARTRQ